MDDAKVELRKFLADYVSGIADSKGVSVEIGDDLYVLGDNLLDSLEFLNLLVAVEQRFQMEIDFMERDIADVTRFGTLVASFAPAGSRA